MLRSKAKGIDYRQIQNRRAWPFNAFIATLAQLLGKKGGITAFTAEELEFLKNLYNRTPALTSSYLEEAVVQADEKTLLAITYQLQKIIARKEN